MNKIKKYSHRFNGTVRDFEINDDFLIFKSKRSWGEKSEAKLDLKKIDPIYDKVWIRTETFKYSAGIFVGSLPIALFAELIFYFEGGGLPFLAHMFFLFIPLLCAILAIINWGKIEFYQFKMDNGLIAFNIGNNGSNKNNFDQFIKELLESIETLKAPNNSAQ